MVFCNRPKPRSYACGGLYLRHLSRIVLPPWRHLWRAFPCDRLAQIELGNGSDQASMVLPDRIELSTSPLPRECSTTELRQRKTGGRRPGPSNGAESAIRESPAQGSRRRRKGRKFATAAPGLAPGTSLGRCAKTLGMTQGKSGERERRAERLAAALKENLKRRKA